MRDIYYFGISIKDLIVKALLNDVIRFDSHRKCFYMIFGYGSVFIEQIIETVDRNGQAIELLAHTLTEPINRPILNHIVQKVEGIKVPDLQKKTQDKPQWSEKDLVPRLDELS